jgi:ATP-dependent exoDNAse (exonuclease V) alpha subunit
VTFDAVGIASFYVAVTRARVSLHIAVSADDKKRLQQLVARNGERQ